MRLFRAIQGGNWVTSGLRVALGCALLLGFAPPVHAQDITTGLVAHWKLDESAGTATDSIGGNTGTLIGGVNYDPDGGRLSGAIAGDGNASSFIRVNDNGAILDSKPNMTVSAWVMFDSYSDGVTYRDIALKEDDQDPWESWGLYLNLTNQIVFTVNGTAPVAYAPAATDFIPELGTWYHVVGVKSGAVTKIYVNGSDASTSSGNLGSSTLIDGNNPGYMVISRNFDGLVDDVRIYNRSLTASDIATLYASWDGHLVYDADSRVPVYFDGTQWVGMGVRKYVPNAVNFDGATGLARGGDLTGNSDTKMVTGSFWIRRTGGLGVQQQIFRSIGNNFRVALTSTNVIHIMGRNAGGTNILNINAATPITDNDWHHVMFSINLNGADYASNAHIYVDGVSDKAATATNFIDDVLDTATTNHTIGMTNSGTEYLQADLADLWIDIGNYLDLSEPSNRLLFYNNAPVYFGSNGSGPTGSAPDVFLSGNTVNWHTNKGTGGGFTENGALTDGATRPGDVQACDYSAGGINFLQQMTPASGSGGTDLVMQDNFLYFVELTSGSFRIIDTSNPAALAERDEVTGLNIPRGIAVQGNYAYVTEYTPDSLRVFNISDPDNIVEVGTTGSLSFNMDGAYDIVVDGNYAYVTAAQGDSVTSINISNPAAPVFVDKTTAHAQMVAPYKIAKQGNYLYVVSNTSKSLAIVDASNPANLVVRDIHVDTAKINGNNVAVRGDYAYVTAGGSSRSFTVYNISDPDDITEVASISDATAFNMATDLTLAGDYAFVTAQQDLTVVDISNPSSPSVVYNYDNGSLWGTQWPIVSGQHLYAASYLHYVVSVDLGCDPTTGVCKNPDAAGGKIVYNASSSVMQYCDGETWRAMGPVPGTGGAGCSNPTKPAGSMVYNDQFRVMQYCDGANWVSVGADICNRSSVAPGTVCSNGTVYAGISPDGGRKMFTTRCDAGQSWNGSACTGTRTQDRAWNNNNNTGYVITGQTNVNTGRANTAQLVQTDSDAITGLVQPHEAAQYCADLVVNGLSDWYLPARAEAAVLYQNRAAIGGFTSGGVWYWTSTEVDNDEAYMRQFDSDWSGAVPKESEGVYLRCVR